MADVAAQPDPAAPYAFVSYASADRARVLPVVDALRAAGVPIWLDQHAIEGGANYGLEIAEAIANCAAFVLLCSTASLASRNVKQEIALAWKRERPYVPLLLEPVTIPMDVEYWLEAAQWIEVLDKPDAEWLPPVLAALASHGIKPPAASPREETKLAGREPELALLREQLAAAAKTGRGGLALIGGEAGIGKTTLAEAVLHDARAQGCIVLEGHCFDLAETPPYGPWVDVFAHFVPSSSAPSLPEAFARRGTVGAVSSQMALFVAVEDFLNALAAQRPIVLLLDDLHWADPASLDLLRYLARSVATLPLLILATYRSDELTRKHPLSPLLPQLAREAGAARIDLGRLADDAVRTLVGDRYGLPEVDTARLAAYLQARAEGNALFVGELLRALEEGEMLMRDGAGWRLGDLHTTAVPTLLRQVIDARVARLDAESQRLLAIAAVVGHEVPLDVWGRVSEGDDAAVLAVVEQGLEARLLIEAASDEAVRFAHALIRETLYEGIPGVRRRPVHRAVGEALAQTPRPDPDAVAYHFQRAGDVRAIEWLTRAGDHAGRVRATSTSRDRYQAALALAEQGGADDAVHGWLLFRLMQVEFHRSAPTYRAYRDAASASAAVAADPVLAAAVIFYRGYIAFHTGAVPEGMRGMEAGVAAIDALLPVDRTRLNALVHEHIVNGGNIPHTTLMLHFSSIGRFAEAMAMADALMDEASVATHGAPLTSIAYCDLHFGLAMAYGHLGRVDEAQAAFARSREAYARAHIASLQVAIEARWELILMALPYQADDIGERRRLANRADTVFRSYAEHAEDDATSTFSLPLLLVEGEWDRAWAIAEAARPWDRHSNRRFASHLPLGELARERGEMGIAWEQVGALLPAGTATEPGSVTYGGTVPIIRLAAALCLDAGDLPTAEVWLRLHDRFLDFSGAVLGQSEGQALWARYHRQAGDIEKAREHAERAHAHASEPRQPLALIAAHRLLGELDTDTGRYDEAATHLDASLVLADACAAPYERALTLLAMAELRAATHDRETARGFVDEVRAICEPLGAKPALARADALLARLSS